MSSVPSLSDLRQLKVDGVETRLRELGLSCSGNFRAQVSRLHEHLSAQARNKANSTSQVPKKTTRRRARPALAPATESPAAATQPDSSPAFTSQQSAEISRVVQDAVASCMTPLTTSMGLPVVPPHAQPTVAAATAAQRAGPVSDGDVVVPEHEYVQPSLASALRPDQESLFLDGDLLAPERPPSIPLPALSDHLTDKIIKREYVDFGRVLGELAFDTSMGPDSGFTLQGTGDHITLVPSAMSSSSRLKKVVDLTSWSEAFSAFAQVALHHDPGRGPELFKYQSTIVKAAARYTFGSWSGFDMSFRARAARSKSSLATSDPELWSEWFTNSILPPCRHCNRQGHLAVRCPCSRSLASLSERPAAKRPFPAQRSGATAQPNAIGREIAAGRMAGPYQEPPFPLTQVSGLGVVPKKSRSVQKWRLIMHLSASVSSAAASPTSG